MAKQEKEIERWVTVNGARVPIFKDGSIGGPKALRDKVKATQDKKTSARKRGIYADDKHADDYSKAIESLKNGKVTKVPLGKVDNATISKAKQAVYRAGDKAGKQYGVLVTSITEKTKEGTYQATGKALSVIELKQTGSKSTPTLKPATKEQKALAEKEVASKKLQAMQEYGVTGARNLSQLRDKLKDYGVGMESADMADIESDPKFMNGEKISLYDKNNNEYRGTFNVYKDGGMEIVGIKKEWHNRKPTDTHTAIDKDFDTKEKQIARNKAEKDERNLTYNRPDEEGYTISKDGKYYYRVFGKGDIEVGHIDKNGDAVVEGNVRSVKEARELNNSLAKYERQRKEKSDSKSENYKKLSKEEKAKTEKYIEDNKWVNKQVNDQLKQGKNYNEVMADVHEAMNSDKQITEKLNQQKAKALAKKQKGKQAIREAKEALKKYGVSRGMYKDFDKLDDVYKKLSKMYPYEISQEDYETIYNLFKSHGEYNRFFEIHNYKNRKKK